MSQQVSVSPSGRIRKVGKGSGNDTSLPSPIKPKADIGKVNFDTPKPVSKSNSLFANEEGRIEKIKDQLRLSVAGLKDTENFKKYLEAASKFHRYSFRNQLLIQLQCNGASEVGSFKSWKDKGYKVNPGEKAIWILAPIQVKAPVVAGNLTEEEAKEKTYIVYKSVPVFDVSQTNAPSIHETYMPIPKGDVPEGMLEDIDSKLKELGYEVRYQDKISGGIRGMVNPKTKVITILNGPKADMASTMLHELAHMQLGHGTTSDKCRGEEEVEAEATAHIALKVISNDKYNSEIDSSSYSVGYIHGWSRGKEDTMLKVGNNISKASKEIISMFITPEPSKPKSEYKSKSKQYAKN